MRAFYLHGLIHAGGTVMSDLNTVSSASPQTVSGLLHQFIGQLSTLLRQELALARTELSQAAAQLLASAGVALSGAALLYAAFLLLLTAAVSGLALLVPIWVAALSLGVVIGAVGFGLLRRGKRLLREAHLAPSRLPQSLRKDKDVLLRRKAHS